MGSCLSGQEPTSHSGAAALSGLVSVLSSRPANRYTCSELAVIVEGWAMVESDQPGTAGIRLQFPCIWSLMLRAFSSRTSRWANPALEFSSALLPPAICCRFFM